MVDRVVPDLHALFSGRHDPPLPSAAVISAVLLVVAPRSMVVSVQASSDRATV
jgi:hypothetical protein